MAHEIRLATIEDIRHFNPNLPPGQRPTVKALVGILDGERVALGGIAMLAGRCMVFLDLKPPARRFKVSIHRYALAMIDDAKAKHRILYAQPDPNEANAKRWLTRFGFRMMKPGVWIWRREPSG